MLLCNDSGYSDPLNKDTLDGLDDGSTQQQNDSGQNYNNDNYNNNYDNDNSQVVPWGGSIY